MSLTNASPESAAAAAKSASHTLAALPASARNAALDAIHSALSAAREDILAANARDMQAARAAAADGRLSESLVSRLDLGKPGRFEDMLKGILDVRDLDDPVGRISLRTKLDDDLILERVSCPIGVLLIIFEARPEVIANIASLALKSGNAAILKGGKESTKSFVAISRTISDALASTDVPNAAVQLITTRDVVPALLSLDRHIDLVIPRGGADLVRSVKSQTRIPVLGHADGLCAAYLAADADAASVPGLLVDAKTGYPAACNSLETLLVQRSALAAGPDGAFARGARALRDKGVELRCDPESKLAVVRALAAGGWGGGGGGGGGDGEAELDDQIVVGDATPEDYDTEFLALILAVKTVAGLDEAVAHINEHGSHHTDAIFTASAADAEAFMARVDSAGVFWNASTRMADGMRYGFGTEVGISTNKIHSRGPVGLEGLTIYKYKVRGKGHVADAYGEGEGKKRFKHEKLPLDG